MYEVETRALVQAVKRNAKRFPPDFMFQLSREELETLRARLGAPPGPGRPALPAARLHRAGGRDARPASSGATGPFTSTSRSCGPSSGSAGWRAPSPELAPEGRCARAAVRHPVPGGLRRDPGAHGAAGAGRGEAPDRLPAARRTRRGPRGQPVGARQRASSQSSGGGREDRRDGGTDQVRRGTRLRRPPRRGCPDRPWAAAACREAPPGGVRLDEGRREVDAPEGARLAVGGELPVGERRVERVGRERGVARAAPERLDEGGPLLRVDLERRGVDGQREAAALPEDFRADRLEVGEHGLPGALHDRGIRGAVEPAQLLGLDRGEHGLREDRAREGRISALT